MNTLLDRFCRYARIDTQADEKATTYPSSTGQLDLGRLLVEELRALGLRDAAQDAHGIVMATVPATADHLSAQASGCHDGAARVSAKCAARRLRRPRSGGQWRRHDARRPSDFALRDERPVQQLCHGAVGGPAGGAPESRSRPYLKPVLPAP